MIPNPSNSQVHLSSAHFTDQFISDMYTGILHTANSPVTADAVQVYDGYGHKTSLQLGSKNIIVNDIDFPNGFLKLLFPVNSIRLSTVLQNPSTLIPETEWELISTGKYIVGVGTGDDGFTTRSFNLGENDGEYEHTLTESETPSHNHEVDSGFPEFDKFVVYYDKRDVNRGEDDDDDKRSYGFRSKPDAQTARITTVGEGKPHNNCPKSYGVFVWRRVS